MLFFPHLLPAFHLSFYSFHGCVGVAYFKELINHVLFKDFTPSLQQTHSGILSVLILSSKPGTVLPVEFMVSIHLELVCVRRRVRCPLPQRLPRPCPSTSCRQVFPTGVPMGVSIPVTRRASWCDHQAVPGSLVCVVGQLVTPVSRHHCLNHYILKSASVLS